MPSNHAAIELTANDGNDAAAAAISADPGVTFAACGNTLRGMEQRAGHPIALIAQAKVVPSGAVRLVELQEQGYAYLKP